MIVRCISAVFVLVSCALGAPCHIIVLHDPEQRVAAESPVTPDNMSRMLTDVIAGGGRVESISKDRIAVGHNRTLLVYGLPG